MFERSELRRLPPEPDQPSPVAAHCALGLLVLFGLRHRPLGASHSEEKDSAKKNRNHPGRSRQGATLQVDDHHLRTETNELPTESEGAEGARKEKRPCSGLTVQGRFEFIRGGYLLSHFRSTIGAAGFNFSVRNGKRWNPRAMNHLSIFQSTRIFGERLGAASTESLCRIR